MATLGSLTRTLDDDFVNTWYEVKAQVTDNVLGATVFSLALQEHGCLQPQDGGEYGWTDTVGYGQVSTQRFKAGSKLTQEVKALDTFVYLPWRFFCVDVNRSLIDDAKNKGKYMIKSYITRRLEAARDGLVQDWDTYLMQWGGAYAAPEQPNGLFDIVAPQSARSTIVDGSAAATNSDTYASGTTNGGLNRTNTFWRNWIQYSAATQADANKIAGPTNAPYSLNLVPDLDHLFNCVSANQESPNFIIMPQNMYEAYMDEARDQSTRTVGAFTKMAVDLGFDACTFRGATMTWSSKMPALHVAMLNLNYVRCNYHPDVWMDMTDWKQTANQLEKVAYILCMTPGLATSQPRRHGLAVYAS
jgi:hypothetical protein